MSDVWLMKSVVLVLMCDWRAMEVFRVVIVVVLWPVACALGGQGSPRSAAGGAGDPDRDAALPWLEYQ